MDNLEQNNEQKIDLEALAGAEDQQEEQQQEESNLSDFEQKQFDEGWRPLEDFSGPEENWKTAKEFANDGKWIAKLNDLNKKVDSQQKDFDSRLENTNKLHEARRIAEIKNLKAEQRNAVDLSDTDAYDDAQSKIEALEKEVVVPAPAAQQTDKAIEDWNEKNPWFFENGEKSNDAKAFYNSYADANPNATTAQTLAYLDKKIGQMYPTQNNTNPRRSQPNVTENSTRQSKRQSKGLTMNDLTPDERQDWNTFGADIFGTEQAYLKTISDIRAK